MVEVATLGITDYVVFSLVLGVSFVIGVLSSLKSSSSPSDFLTASRSMHYLPVGFSLVTSFMSSISILGMSGDTYANGIQLYMFVVGSVLGIYLTTYTSLPVFASLHLTSMNEYTQKRFKCRPLTYAISIMFIIKSMLYMGVCLYAPTIALAAVTPLDMYTYIYILGVICTIYSTVGGMRAVVWTDVFQMVVMAFGLVVIVALGCNEVGGVSHMWSVSENGNRTQLFDFNPDPYVRHTFWNTLMLGFAGQSFTFGIDQLNLQRIASVPTEKDAQKLLIVTAIGMLGLYVLVFWSGLVTYAFYAGCDPISLGIIDKKEEILPYFIMDKFSFIYGLPGLFVATLFSGTLSSLSSSLNGVVAMIWKDFLEDLPFFRKSADSVGLMANRILSIIIGLTSIGIAILCSKSGSLTDLNSILLGVCIGPVYGVFLLGLMFPVCKAKGAAAGLLSSAALVLWIAVGSSLYGPPTPHLPYSVDECNSTEIFLNMTSGIETWADIPIVGNTYIESSHMLNIYKISYTLYPVFSPVVCIVVGLLVTYITGKQDPNSVPAELISPFIRRMYWTKDSKDIQVRRFPKLPESEMSLHRRFSESKIELLT